MSEETQPTYPEKMVAALLREREAYVTRELPDRVKDVDKQLAAYGHKPEAPKGRTQAPKDET